LPWSKALDSKVTTYPELCRLHQWGVWFVSIRRRGTAVVRRLRQLLAMVVIDTPRRFHQHIRYVDETVQLLGYGGALQQVAIDGLGKEQPTRLPSDNIEETARNLVIRLFEPALPARAIRPNRTTSHLLAGACAP
jgi:hypothetical protein